MFEAIFSTSLDVVLSVNITVGRLNKLTEHFFSYHWHEAFFVLNGLIGSSKNAIVIFLFSEYWTSTWVYQCLNEGLGF